MGKTASRLNIEGGSDGKVYITDHGKRVFAVSPGHLAFSQYARGLARVTIKSALEKLDDD